MRPGTVLFFVAALSAGAADWLQWGGPTRDFRVPDPGLKAWPESGPRKAWTRVLGEGYSAVLAEGNRIYTVYRNGSRELVLAADAATGKTTWEQGCTSTFRSDAPDLGHGPHATPLIAGDRLFVVSVAGRLMCLDKGTGKEIWAHGLISEMGGTRLMYGYASTRLPTGTW